MGIGVESRENFNWCFKSCKKTKVIPVFVVPGPNFKLDMDETPTKVVEIQPNEI